MKDNLLNLFKNNEILAPYYNNLLSLIQKKKDLIENSGINENYNEFIGNMKELKKVTIEFLRTKNVELSENIYELEGKLNANINKLIGQLQELTDLDKLSSSYYQNLNQLNSTIQNYIAQLSQSELTLEQLADLIRTHIPNLSDNKAELERIIKPYIKKLEVYTKNNQLIQQLKNKQLDLEKKITSKLENAGVLENFAQHSKSLNNLINSLKSLIDYEEQKEQLEQMAYQFKDVKIKNVIEFVNKIPTIFNSDSLGELSSLDPEILMTKIQTELQNSNINPTEEQMALLQEFLVKLVPIAQECTELIQYIQNKGILDAFQEYAASLNGLYDSFKTLTSEDIKKLQKTINSIQKTYEKFDINEKINDLKNMTNLSQGTVERLKNLIEANVDLDELKKKLENIDPQQLSTDTKNKITELLKNIRTKTKDLGQNPIIAQIIGKLESYKEQIQQNEVVIAFEDYIQSLEKLCQSVEFITVGKIDMIKQAAYDLSGKLKNYNFDPSIDTLFNYKILSAKLGEKINDLQAKITPILDDVKKYLSEYDFKSMPDVQRQKVVELLGKIKKQIEEFKKNNPKFEKFQQELKLKIVDNDLYKELNEQVVLANNLWNAYKQLYINDAESLKDRFENIKDTLDKINGTNLILQLNSTLFNEKDNLLENIENIGKKEINLGKINTILEENVKKLKDINKEKVEDISEGLKIKIKDIISAITGLKDKITLDNLSNIDLASILENIQNKDILQPKLQEILAYFQEKTDGNEKLAEILEIIKKISKNAQNELKEVNENISEKLNKTNINLESIRDYLSNLDSEDSQLLLKANEFIQEKIKKYPQLQPILDSLNDVKDNVEGRINDVKETVDNKIKEANNTIFENLEKFGILNRLQEYYKSLEELKAKTNDIKIDEKIQKIKEQFLELKDTITNIDVKEFESDLRVFLNDDKNEWIATLFDIETIKKNNEKIKEVFSKAKSSMKIQIEQAKKALKNMKLKIESLKDNPNFSKLKEQLNKLNDAIMETSLIKPLKDNLDIFKEQIPKIKGSLEDLKKIIDILSFDDSFEEIKKNVKDFNFKETLIQLNSTKNEYLEEFQKYQDLETKGEQLKVLLNIGSKIDTKKAEMIQKLIESIKEKIKLLDQPKLEEIINKIDELNTGITQKIDKEKIKKTLDDYFTDLAEKEKKFNNFPEAKETEDYQKAANELKESVEPNNALSEMNKSLNDDLGILSDTINILKLIAQKYKDLPADEDPSELNKNITELIEEQYEKLKTSSKKSLENTLLGEYIQKAIEGKEKIDKEKVKEFFDSIRENITNIGIKLNDLKEQYKDKPMKDIVEEMKEKIKDFDENSKFMESQPEFIKKIYETIKSSITALADKIDVEKLEKIKEQLEKKSADVKDKLQIDQMKADLNDFILKAKTIKENLQKLSKSDSAKSLKDTINNLKEELQTIDFTELLNLFRAIENAQINVEQEIDNLKRLKELSDEMEQIYSSSIVLQKIKGLLPGILMKSGNLPFGKRQLSSLKKKTKKTKQLKVKKLRRADSESTLTCKLDEEFSKGQTLTEEASNLDIYVLKGKSSYNIQIQQSLSLRVKEDSSYGCDNSYMTNIYRQRYIVYKSHTEIIRETIKKRIFFKFYVSFAPTFVRPKFYYLKIKVTIRRSSSNSLRRLDNEEADAFCLLEDDSDIQNAEHDCYAFPENVETVDGIHNLKSPIVIDMPNDSASGTETTTPTGGDGTETTTPTGGDGTETTTPTGSEGTETTTPTGGDGTETTTPTGGDGTETTTPTGGDLLHLLEEMELKLLHLLEEMELKLLHLLALNKIKHIIQVIISIEKEAQDYLLGESWA